MGTAAGTDVDTDPDTDKDSDFHAMVDAGTGIRSGRSVGIGGGDVGTLDIRQRRYFVFAMRSAGSRLWYSVTCERNYRIQYSACIKRSYRFDEISFGLPACLLQISCVLRNSHFHCFLFIRSHHFFGSRTDNFCNNSTVSDDMQSE